MNQEKVKEGATKNNIPLVDDITGQFLMWLTAFKKPLCILEIGFGAGYSALWMASAFPKAKIISLEKNQDRYEKGLELLKTYPQLNITLLFEDARKYLKTNTAQFDLVFFDGVKSQYLLYFDLIKPFLNPQALLISDNLFYRGKIVESYLSPKKKKEVQKSLLFYQNLSKNPQFLSIFLPIADGIALALYQGEVKETK